MKKIFVALIIMHCIIIAQGETRNIVPRANNEGKIGLLTKKWMEGHFGNIYYSSIVDSLLALKLTTSTFNSTFDTRLATKTLDNISAGSTNVHLTTTLKTNYDAAHTALHTHTNKSKLDSVSVAASLLNGITASFTSVLKTNYDGYASLISGKEQIITPGTTAQYWRGDKTWQTLPISGWTLGSTKVYPTTAGNKVHIRTNAGDSTGTSLLNVYGSLFVQLETKTSSLNLTGIASINNSTYTVLTTDSFVQANAISNAITLTLPTASNSSGKIIIIKKIDSSNNRVTIDGYSNETIDGELTLIIYNQHDSYILFCDGSNWLII